MDQTCLDRSGGLAPTIFPLFQGPCLWTTRVPSVSLVMVTSSASELADSQVHKLLKRCLLFDDCDVLWPSSTYRRVLLARSRLGSFGCQWPLSEVDQTSVGVTLISLLVTLS